MNVEVMTRRLVRENGCRVIYTMTTDDKFQFPVAVADSPSELARITGKTKGCVASSLTHGRSTFHKIVMTEEESLEMDLEDAALGNLDAIEHLLQRRSEEDGTKE